MPGKRSKLPNFGLSTLDSTTTSTNRVTTAISSSTIKSKRSSVQPDEVEFVAVPGKQTEA